MSHTDTEEMIGRHKEHEAGTGLYCSRNSTEARAESMRVKVSETDESCKAGLVLLEVKAL
jgi:hypothetical protein